MENLLNIVNKRFEYKDGKLLYKESPSNRVKVGKEAGYINTNSYKQVQINGKRYLVHRIIFLMHYGYMPENDIDHIDGNKLNNRIENLREVSKSCNMKNCKPYNHNTSGFHGVYWNKQRQKWMAYINNINLGRYPTKEQAALARALGELLHWPDQCNKQQTIFKQIREANVNPPKNLDDFKKFKNLKNLTNKHLEGLNDLLQSH